MDADAQTPRAPTTLRRNPPRRTKNTPFPTTTAAVSVANSIIPFPLDELLHPDLPANLSKPSTTDASSSSETLKVFLRVRPHDVRPPRARHPGGNARARGKAASPKKGRARSNNACLVVNSSSSVTLSVPAPPSVNESKRAKSEVYDGFSFVFPPESSQREIYDRVMHPLVVDFMGGKSALLAAMGPTGSGKTHTMFGSPRDPGMVPLALRHIFGNSSKNNHSRSYYLSMFEINSERGKGERILDLSPDGADISLHQSYVKGLQEVMVSSITEAERLVACGMLKRATAMTNANSQSSRSQCIISIRSALNTRDDENQFLQNNVVLTIADLAGAERERKTGNQGVRLLESSFINNTSMVLGQCLRSLLEHQKNPKKPLQKHYKNSMLTRYLKEYLEGKKRMTLILTVKPGEDDYLDTSFLLRQASPYMKIKFSASEEFSNIAYPKRNATCIRTEQIKRRKFNDSDAALVDGGQDDKDAVIGQQISEKEDHSLGIQGSISPQISNVPSECLKIVDVGKAVNEDTYLEWQRMVRNNEVMRNFAKALWNILKEYKKRLEVSENEVQSLKETLEQEITHVAMLEKELKELRSCCSCHKHPLLVKSSNREQDTLSNNSETGPSVSSPSQPTLDNVDVTHDDNLFPLTICQIPEGSVTTQSDPEIKSLQTKGISMDADITGDKSITHSSLEETQDHMLQLKEEEPKGQMPESFLQREHISKNLKVLKDFVIPGISYSLNCREEADSPDTNSSISSFEVEDRTRLCSSMDYDPLMEDKEYVDRKCKGFIRDNDSKGVKELKNAGFYEVPTNGSLRGGAHSNPQFIPSQSCATLQDVESVSSSPIACGILSKKEVKMSNIQKHGFSQEIKYICELKELKDSQDASHIGSLTDPLVDLSHSESQVEDEKSFLPMSGKHVTSRLEDVELRKLHPSSIDHVRQNDKCQVGKFMTKEHDSASKAHIAGKPRRRLLPASTLLLKEFSGIDIEAENPKESRGRPAVEDEGRSQGSISLLRLLRSNFHQ